MTQSAPQDPKASYEVRPIEPNDYSWVIQANNAGLPQHAMSQHFLASFLDFPGHHLIALENGKPAGFLLGLNPGSSYPCPFYRWFSGQFGTDFVYLDRIIVEEPMRRRGVATALCNAAAERTQGDQRGRLTMEVFSQPPDAPLLGLLGSLGFDTVITRPLSDGRSEIALMAKALA